MLQSLPAPSIPVPSLCREMLLQPENNHWQILYYSPLHSCNKLCSVSVTIKLKSVCVLVSELGSISHAGLWVLWQFSLNNYDWWICFSGEIWDVCVAEWEKAWISDWHVCSVSAAATGGGSSFSICFISCLVSSSFYALCWRALGRPDQPALHHHCWGTAHCWVFWTNQDTPVLT